MGWLTRVICRTIGCTSIFARWWEWPHRYVCSPLASLELRLMGFDDDPRKLRMRIVHPAVLARAKRYGIDVTEFGFPDPYERLSDAEFAELVATLPRGSRWVDHDDWERACRELAAKDRDVLEALDDA